MKYDLAIIGFGNVGQGLAEILATKSTLLHDRYKADIQIVAICDLLKGSIADPAGFDPQAILNHIRSDGDLKHFPAPYKDWDARETIKKSGANVLVELSYTDLETGEPALSHIVQALELGMHVATTNKGPAALHFPRLLALSESYGGSIGVEGTVMSGTPTLTLGMNSLIAASITRIQGILNGTTNYILGEMEKGAEYSSALEDAQAQGYAEADPTGDVDGHDAAAKVVILANLVMGQSMTLKDVHCLGISGITKTDIEAALEADQRWKLIGTVDKRDGAVQGSVQPVRVGSDHPLHGIGGATNAITFSTELLGDITLIGPGAGRIETGYALIGDILSFSR